MIRIVLIDDHALMRDGLKLLLTQPGSQLDVVGEAADGESGLALIRKLEPDIALLDLHMPKMTGIEVTERVRKAGLRTAIIILTVAGEAPFPRRLLEAGAGGYLTKACPAHELLAAVRSVADGRRYLAPSIAQQLALEVVHRQARSPFEELTARELEVAIRFAQGADAQSIARHLKISDKTVATHKARVFHKVGIDNVVALAHLAQLHGLLDPGGPPATHAG